MQGGGSMAHSMLTLAALCSILRLRGTLSRGRSPAGGDNGVIIEVDP